MVLLSLLFVIATVIVSVVVVPWVIVRLPADYFSHDRPHHEPFSGFSHPLQILLIIGKNLLGLLLVFVGMVLLVLPGQGVIVILIGVSLLDFPRKKQLERWLISRGPLLKFANWLRVKWHKEPLVVD